MLSALYHFILPQESNNHRAKLLHHKSLFFFAIGILFFQVLFLHVKQVHPEVLGTSTDISSQKLLALTNQQRAIHNLPPLKLNQQLSLAADRKAQDMFKSNYWAHFSPIGITPWDFIKGANYDYSYAGENLARGFTSSSDVINAWMQSPSHRDNQLSPNYQDVGYAVEDGELLGEQTTLVVEEFGAPAATAQDGTITPSPTVAPQPVTVTKNEPVVEVAPTAAPRILAANLSASTLIDGGLTAKTITFMFLALFIVLFIVDAIIIERKKIVRLIGNHVDHTLFFLLLLVFAAIFTKQAIL